MPENSYVCNMPYNKQEFLNLVDVPKLQATVSQYNILLAPIKKWLVTITNSKCCLNNEQAQRIYS